MQRPKASRQVSASALSPQTGVPRQPLGQSPGTGSPAGAPKPERISAASSPATAAVRHDIAAQPAQQPAAAVSPGTALLSQPASGRDSASDYAAQQKPAQAPADQEHSTISTASPTPISAAGQSKADAEASAPSTSASPAAPEQAATGPTVPGASEVPNGVPVASSSAPATAAADDPVPSTSDRQASVAVAEAIARAAEAAGVPPSSAAGQLSGSVHTPHAIIQACQLLVKAECQRVSNSHIELQLHWHVFALHAPTCLCDLLQDHSTVTPCKAASSVSFRRMLVLQMRTRQKTELWSQQERPGSAGQWNSCGGAWSNPERRWSSWRPCCMMPMPKPQVSFIVCLR